MLRTHKLGEADRIVTLLTRQHGKVRAVAKGVRRTASKFGARLEPFMVADVQFYEGRTLDVITQAESLGAYGVDISADYSSFTVANVMVETADKLSESEGSLQQYLLLVGGLRSLARREHGASSTLDSYLLRALALAGWAPSFEDCARCGGVGEHTAIVVQLGGNVCNSCAPPGSPRITHDTRALLGALLSGNWSVVDAASAAACGQASGIVAAYTQWHLERGLRSMPHVFRSVDGTTRTRGESVVPGESGIPDELVEPGASSVTPGVSTVAPGEPVTLSTPPSAAPGLLVPVTETARHRPELSRELAPS